MEQKVSGRFLLDCDCCGAVFMLSGLSKCVQLIILLMNSFAVSSEPPSINYL